MKSKKSKIFKILVFGAINPQITTQYLQAQSQGVKHKNFHKYPKKTENIGVFPFGGAPPEKGRAPGGAPSGGAPLTRNPGAKFECDDKAYITFIGNPQTNDSAEPIFCLVTR